MSHRGDVFGPVLEALAADSSTEFGAPGARVEVLRTIEGRFSTVQRVRIQTPARTSHAYIKVLKPRGRGQEELALSDRMLEREYRATLALYHALRQDDGLGALRPLAVVPQLRAIATEEVPGRPWGELLAAATTLTGELRNSARRVGSWVRVYQSVVETAGTVDLAARRSYIDDRLALLEGRVISSETRRAVLLEFDTLVNEVGAAAVPAVAIHADLTPMNVIIDDGGRVTVLDFTMAKKGTRLHDVSHVYFHLELMAARHRGRRELFHAVQRDLLSGFDPALSSQDPLFRMMMIQHGVCHIALLAERRVPLLDVAYRWFLKRRWGVCARMSARPAGLRVA